MLEKLKLASLVAQLQGFSSAQAYVSELMAQVGIDLRSRDDLIRAGIDPDRGLGIALLPSGLAYTVLPVRDVQKLEDALAALARNRLGAEVRTRSQGAQAVVTFSRSAGSAPELSLVVGDGFALVAPGDSSSPLVAFASLPFAESFAGDASLSAGLGRLPAQRDLYVHLPAGSGLAKQYGIGEWTLAVDLAEDALRLRADQPWTGAPALLTLLKKQDGARLLHSLPADAFAVAQFNGDPLSLEGIWPHLVGPHVARAVEQSAFDLKGELLTNLKPGAVASLSVAPTAVLFGMPELDVHKTNPFRFVHLVAVGEVKDVPRAEETLRKIPAVAARFGAKVEPTKRGGKIVYVSSYAQGEGVDVAPFGDKVVIAAPLHRLDEALARLTAEPNANAGPIADPLLRQLLDERAVAAVLDFPQLIRAVKNLPTSAWGVGGFAIKATTVRWLEAMDDLRAITAGAWATEGAIQVEVELKFVHPEPLDRARDTGGDAKSRPHSERGAKPEAEGGRP